MTCVNVVSGDEIRVSYLMGTDPLIQIPPITWRLNDGLIPLWRQALARPEAEYQLRVSESVARAHSEGLDGMDAFEPDLIRIVSAESTHPAARFAAARALIVLDARDAAESLFQASRDFGGEFRMLIEPALARWDYRPPRALWLQRLANPRTGRRELILAAECAAQVHDPDALPQLLEIARRPEGPADIRLATARAAGQIADSGLEDHAAEFTAAASGSIVDRLCAVALLTRHSSPAARQKLIQLAGDAEPSIAAAALELLLAIDPELVLPLVESTLESFDANVRLRGAEAYIALPTPDRISVLANVLDDPHPEVRETVCEALYEHAAQPELDAAVRESVVRVLERESWRGQEQAALLLAALDHEPAAPRMIELLESDRPEVMIATAWGLRVLAIPETAPALLDVADRQTVARLAGEVDALAVDIQVAHLFEALGLLEYQAAGSLLRRYVPKSLDYGEDSRGAAVWALGHLHAGEPDDELAAQLMGRVTDNGIPPELEIVQLMSIVSIGRMQATSQLSALRGRIGPTVDHGVWDYITHWAIQQMADDEIPLAPPVVVIRDGWFLEPLKD